MHGPEHAHLSLVAGHDGHVAGQRQRLDQTRAADFGHFHVVGLVLGRAGDVFGRAVRIVGHDQDLLLRLFAQRPLRRKHLDPLDRRVPLAAIGHALQNPAPQQSVRVRIVLQPGTAAMRGHADRLEQQQALFGRSGEQPPAATLLDQVLEVLARLEAQQRQLEPVLAPRLAVATAAVAAQLGEDRHDLIRKVDRHFVAPAALPPPWCCRQRHRRCGPSPWPRHRPAEKPVRWCRYGPCPRAGPHRSHPASDLAIVRWRTDP